MYTRQTGLYIYIILLVKGWVRFQFYKELFAGSLAIAYMKPAMGEDYHNVQVM